MNLIGAGIGRGIGQLIGEAAAYLGFAALVGVGIYMIRRKFARGIRRSSTFQRGWGLP